MLIWDFARLGQVSVLRLRHYDAIGLLVPDRVDPSAATALTHPSSCTSSIASSHSEISASPSTRCNAS